MVNVSLFINSSKLRDAVVSNFDLERVQFAEENQWSESSSVLFNAKNDLLIIDFNAIKNETLDVFLSINKLCENNGIKFVLLVKRKSDGLRELESKLDCLKEIVETQSGRKEFDRALRRIVAETAERKHQTKSKDSNSGQKEIHLPLEDKGNINDTSVFNILFSILVRRATGILTLVNGARNREFAFRRGSFVSTDTTKDSIELIDAIAWKTGTYEFEKKDRLAGRSKPLEGILAKGVRESLTNSDAMRALMSHMSLFPALTSRFEDARKLRDSMPELSKFSKFFERGLTWQEILADEGEVFFKVAYFAINTYLIDSSKDPNTQVSVSWSQDTRRALERGEREKIEKTTAFKTAQNPENVERELRITLRDMEYQTPYEIFGVWKGCGRDVVSERFYELVKQRHPDIYGNVSTSVKGYAQKIFIGIKKSYSELLSLEKFDAVQTAGEPSFVITSEVSEVAEDDTPFDVVSEAFPDSKSKMKVKPARVRSESDVQTKMGQLSAMRKKRSRRRSLAETKSKIETLPPVAVSEAERILSEVSEVAEPQPSTPQPSIADERKSRFTQLKNRARKKNPNAISEAQELFSAGYQLYREDRIALAHEKFDAANTLDDRALHLAFFAYTSFLIDSANADESEKLIRKAIEMNDKQTQPDALFFMAKILKHRGDLKNALSFFEKAFALNPTNREAEREIRLSRLRNVRKNTDPGEFIKKLFKK